MLHHPDRPRLRPDLRAEIAALPWWHSIDFGDVVSRGQSSLDYLIATADIFFEDDITGATVLDIGAWDGFFSLEACRRGALRVLATDSYVWQRGRGRRNIEIVRQALAPALGIREIDVMDMMPTNVGGHDVVIFSGVLYHLRHPFLGLEKAASVCKEMLIVETQIDAANYDRPAMVFYPGNELAGDATNWWGPNGPCVEAMLRDLGFGRIVQTSGLQPARAIFRAYR